MKITKEFKFPLIIDFEPYMESTLKDQIQITEEDRIELDKETKQSEIHAKKMDEHKKKKIEDKQKKQEESKPKQLTLPGYDGNNNNNNNNNGSSDNGGFIGPMNRPDRQDRQDPIAAQFKQYGNDDDALAAALQASMNENNDVHYNDTLSEARQTMPGSNNGTYNSNDINRDEIPTEIFVEGPEISYNEGYKILTRGPCCAGIWCQDSKRYRTGILSHKIDKSKRIIIRLLNDNHGGSHDDKNHEIIQFPTKNMKFDKKYKVTKQQLNTLGIPETKLGYYSDDTETKYKDYKTFIKLYNENKGKNTTNKTPNTNDDDYAVIPNGDTIKNGNIEDTATQENNDNVTSNGDVTQNGVTHETETNTVDNTSKANTVDVEVTPNNEDPSTVGDGNTTENVTEPVKAVDATPANDVQTSTANGHPTSDITDGNQASEPTKVNDTDIEDTAVAAKIQISETEQTTEATEAPKKSKENNDANNDDTSNNDDDSNKTKNEWALKTDFTSFTGKEIGYKVGDVTIVATILRANKDKIFVTFSPDQGHYRDKNGTHKKYDWIKVPNPNLCDKPTTPPPSTHHDINQLSPDVIDGITANVGHNVNINNLRQSTPPPELMKSKYNTNSKYIYVLNCVIVHRGSAYHGHYFAYICDHLHEHPNQPASWKSKIQGIEASLQDNNNNRIENKNDDDNSEYSGITKLELTQQDLEDFKSDYSWYNFNDETVRTINSNMIAKQYKGDMECAYLLFYRHMKASYYNSQLPKDLIEFIKKDNEILAKEKKKREEMRNKCTVRILNPKSFAVVGKKLTMKPFIEGLLKNIIKAGRIKIEATKASTTATAPTNNSNDTNTNDDSKNTSDNNDEPIKKYEDMNDDEKKEFDDQKAEQKRIKDEQLRIKEEKENKEIERLYIEQKWPDNLTPTEIGAVVQEHYHNSSLFVKCDKRDSIKTLMPKILDEFKNKGIIDDILEIPNNAKLYDLKEPHNDFKNIKSIIGLLDKNIANNVGKRILPISWRQKRYNTGYERKEFKDNKEQDHGDQYVININGNNRNRDRDRDGDDEDEIMDDNNDGYGADKEDEKEVNSDDEELQRYHVTPRNIDDLNIMNLCFVWNGKTINGIPFSLKNSRYCELEIRIYKKVIIPNVEAVLEENEANNVKSKYEIEKIMMEFDPNMSFIEMESKILNKHKIQNPVYTIISESDRDKAHIIYNNNGNGKFTTDVYSKANFVKLLTQNKLSPFEHWASSIHNIGLP